GKYFRYFSRSRNSELMLIMRLMPLRVVMAAATSPLSVAGKVLFDFSPQICFSNSPRFPNSMCSAAKSSVKISLLSTSHKHLILGADSQHSFGDYSRIIRQVINT